MSTLPELLASFREDIANRYRSPVLGPFAIAFLAVHWRIGVYVTIGQKTPEAIIQFVESHVSVLSIGAAVGISLLYVLCVPWVELAVSRLAAIGKRRRNEFQFQEQQREISSKKVIAARETELIEQELKNAKNQSKLQDIEQLRQYQNLLSGENLARWVNDIKRDAIHPHLESGIVSYVNRHDTVEGRYVDAELEEVHSAAVQALSTFGSSLAQHRSDDRKAPAEAVHSHGLAAAEAQQKFRKLAREKLGV